MAPSVSVSWRGVRLARREEGAARRAVTGARQCAPRGRGAGHRGPRERPRGVRGVAPSKEDDATGFRWAPSDSVSWRGVRLARREEGAARRAVTGARQCAPRGRRAGHRGPRERPRGVRGVAPSKEDDATGFRWAPSDSVSWRGVRLARREEGAARRAVTGARQCAPRGRRAGHRGPRERPRGVRGVAPSKEDDATGFRWAPSDSVSWRGVRLARREEGAARWAVTDDATQSRRTPRQET